MHLNLLIALVCMELNICLKILLEILVETDFIPEVLYFEDIYAIKNL